MNKIIPITAPFKGKENPCILEKNGGKKQSLNAEKPLCQGKQKGPSYRSKPKHEIMLAWLEFILQKDYLLEPW